MEEKDINPKTIRTYESDIANAIQHRQASQASMVLAEEKKSRKKNDVIITNTSSASNKTPKWKSILMVTASVVFLVAGVSIAYYFYTISPLSVQQPLNPATNTSSVIQTSIITPDQQKVIDVTNLSTESILNQIEKQSQTNIQPNGILEILFVKQASTTQSGQKITSLVRVSGPQFISMMGLVPPDALSSTLTGTMMFGLYSSSNNVIGTTSSPFIILTENFFQNAFAGMLSWEPTMPSDLSALFNIQNTQWSSGSFRDKLVKNKDVREFTDATGNTLFLYSFINSNTLVIAQNEDTLKEIIVRFENRAYVR